MLQKGGTVVKRGSYGCIISPNKPCVSSSRGSIQSEKYVSKLFYGNNGVKTRDEEWKELNEVAKIDPSFEFTVEPIESCSIYNGSADVLACTNKALVPQIILRYGGPDLHGFARGVISPISYNNFIESFRILIKGFKALEEADMVHRDIKPGNILYNENKNRFYIVDFGLACKRSEVYKRGNEHILDYKYPYYPPEFRILAHLYKSGTNDQQMGDIIKNAIKARSNNEVTDIMRESIKNMIEPAMDDLDVIVLIDVHKNDVYEFLNSLLDSFRSGKFKKFAEDMSKLVDIYSLGVTMNYLYDNDFIKCNDRIQQESLEFIFKRMTNANPLRRSSAATVLEQLDILTKTKTKK